MEMNDVSGCRTKVSLSTCTNSSNATSYLSQNQQQTTWTVIEFWRKTPKGWDCEID